MSGSGVANGMLSNISPPPILSSKNSFDKKKLMLLDSARQPTSHKMNSPGGHQSPNPTPVSVHQVIADGVEMVLKKAAASRSLDNITVLILGFKNFENII